MPRLRLLLALLLARPGLVLATNFYADAAAGSDANSCLAPGAGNACKTLTHALALANAAASPPHAVHAAAGKYDDVVNGETFPLRPGDGISLIGDFGAAVTTITQVNTSTAAILYNRNMTMPSSTILDGFGVFNANRGAGADAVSISPQAPGAALAPILRNSTFSATSQAGIRINSVFPTASLTPQVRNSFFPGGGAGISFNGDGLLGGVFDGNAFFSPAAQAILLQTGSGSGDNFSPQITNNVFTGGSHAIDVEGGPVPAVASPVISNNTVTAAAGIGIVIYGRGHGLTTAAVISGNTVRNSGGTAVYSWGGGGLHAWLGGAGDGGALDVNGNLVSGCTGYAVAVGDSGTQGASPTIRNNTVTGSKGWMGLYFYAEGTSSISVTSNTTTGNAVYGLGSYTFNTVSPLISFNTITGNGSNGIYLYGTNTSSPAIVSNTITGNGYSGMNLLGTFATASPPVIKDNWLSGNGSPEVLIQPSGGEISPIFSSNTILAQGTTVGMLITGNSKIDLGGGALGSLGHNTIRGAGGAYDLDFAADPNRLSADYNWWTDFPPVHNNNGAAGVDVSTSMSPALSFLVDHTSGPLSGGTLVTLTAENANTAFVDNVGAGPARISVLVGGTPATSVQVNAAGTRLTAVTPPGTAGGVSILARNPAGQLGSGSNSRGFTYVAAPAAPGSLSAAALGVSSINWTWASVAGAAAYFFYPSTGGPPIYSTSTAVLLVGLSSNTAYGARVSAVNVGGEGPKTPAAAVYTMAGPVASPAGAATTATLNPPTGLITVTIPPGAFPTTVQVTVRTPPAFPAAAGGLLLGTGVGVEIDLDQALQPSVPVPITVSFRDSDVAGLDKTTLILARYDPTLGAWVPLESTVDAARDTVTALTRHFSIFQIMASSPAQDLSAARVIPNPFMPNRGHVAMGFFNLPPFALVRLYTPAGLLIRSLTANAAGLAVWDGNNQAGAKAASGVYYALVQAVGKSRTLTVAIER